METTASRDVICSSISIQLDTEEQQENFNKQEQTMHAEDDLRKSLSPLINSMRVFGLYFNRQPCVSTATTNQQSSQSLRKCNGCWNPGRVYATVMLVVMCINAFRYAIVFDGTDEIGAPLIMKISLLASRLLIVVLQTAYYVASHTGSLDRVFRRVDLPTADISPKYGRTAKVLTAICWALVVFSSILYIYPFGTYGKFNDLSTLVIFDSLPGSKTYAYIIAAIFAVFDVQHTASFCFPQAMNYVVVSLLCDQFAKLNKEFGKCIGGRGEFHGNFEQFRRRHQAISHSVKEADRFAMISNVACFCCHMLAIIVAFFFVIFYRPDCVLRTWDVTFQYIYWLVINVLGLFIAAGLAISVNNKVCTTISRISTVYQDISRRKTTHSVCAAG